MVAGVQGVLPFSSFSKVLSNHYPIGDFTKSLVENPPKALWTRELKVSLASLHNHSKDSDKNASNLSPRSRRQATICPSSLHRSSIQLIIISPLYFFLKQLAGVSNSSKLYKRGIRICTGTGIGAALSTCIQSPDW
jgi:hypothetical protein